MIVVIGGSSVVVVRLYGASCPKERASRNLYLLHKGRRAKKV